MAVIGGITLAGCLINRRVIMLGLSGTSGTTRIGGYVDNNLWGIEAERVLLL